jgi:hypothetical protein
MIESKRVNHLLISLVIGVVCAVIGVGVSIAMSGSIEARWLFALGGFLIGFLDPFFALQMKYK